MPAFVILVLFVFPCVIAVPHLVGFFAAGDAHPSVGVGCHSPHGVSCSIVPPATIDGAHAAFS
jgi:hypothetical protein